MPCPWIFCGAHWGHWRRLVKNIGGNRNLGENVVKTVSGIFLGRARAVPQVYAYGWVLLLSNVGLWVP